MLLANLPWYFMVKTSQDTLIGNAWFLDPPGLHAFMFVVLSVAQTSLTSTRVRGSWMPVLPPVITQSAYFCWPVPQAAKAQQRALPKPGSGNQVVPDYRHQASMYGALSGPMTQHMLLPPSLQRQSNSGVRSIPRAPPFRADKVRAKRSMLTRDPHVALRDLS